MRKPNYVHNMTVRQAFGCPGNRNNDCLGLEIEVEGTNLVGVGDRAGEVPNQWVVHADGSLRGESAEYVFRNPLVFNNAVTAIERLIEAMPPGEPVWSSRTSVHVHVNHQHNTIKQVYQVLTLYFILECALSRFAGEDRIGNLFCLRGVDAEGQIDMLRTAARRDTYALFGRENNRYFGANVHSLLRFGTLEFRTMRGTLDLDELVNWMSFLLRIKEKALEYANPAAIVEDLSMRGIDGFWEHIWTPEQARLLDYPERAQDIWECVRCAQEIAYASSWYEDTEQAPQVNDEHTVFGRAQLADIERPDINGLAQAVRGRGRAPRPPADWVFAPNPFINGGDR